MASSVFSAATALTRRSSVRRTLAASLASAALLATPLIHSDGAGAATEHSSSSARSADDTPTANQAALGRQFAKAMLDRLNLERSMHGLPALTMNAKLIQSAHWHNERMAYRNDMSHQLPHEAVFSTRISHAGYKWQAAGENIAWNSDESENGALYLEQIMYDEKAPDNGHRLNILSRAYTNVGIDVIFDATHSKMWITQDFGEPMR